VKITSDWHIHSRHSCDEAALPIADLIGAADDLGLRDFGLSDHIHTPHNLPDLVASRADFLANDPPARFHFGAEASVVSAWELAELATGSHERPTYGLRQGGPPGGPLALGLTEEDVEQLGIEYVIGGAHWPMYVPFERNAVNRDYHRQNLFLATHPLADIVAHPWWWMGHWQSDDGRYRGDPWLDDFGKIPASMHDEFAAAVVEHGKRVEINLSAILLNAAYPDTFTPQYLEYLALLRARNVRFSIGSDCHSARYDPDFGRAEAMLEAAGLGDEAFWRLPPRESREA
jgi:histidinol phosphatase-like PHP family hydrolase